MRNPDLSIGGFEMWVYGHQFPEAEDYWDGGWLSVHARCQGDSAVVETGGPILHASELQQFLVQCKQIYDSLTGEARLDCMEQNIHLEIQMENRGQCQLSVSITPNHLYQEHHFIFDLDQSYLQPLIHDLEKILQAYPLKHQVT